MHRYILKLVAICQKIKAHNVVFQIDKDTG